MKASKANQNPIFMHKKRGIRKLIIHNAIIVGGKFIFYNS